MSMNDSVILRLSRGGNANDLFWTGSGWALNASNAKPYSTEAAKSLLMRLYRVLSIPGMKGRLMAMAALSPWGEYSLFARDLQG